MKVSLIAVCHHSSAVLPRCVASFRREAEAAGAAPEVVVVEQSEDESEAAEVAACAPDLVLREANRGYAAGLNTGMAAAGGDVFFLANPDIEFLDGSVGGLVDVVVGGTDVVGPQLFWDPAGEVVLPIPDDPGPAAELARTLRRRWPGTSRLTDRIDASWRVWTGEEPVEVPSLRGPVLSLRRETAQRLGPLDEDYFLYYEETDWLWRARRMGACLRLAPRARVAHRWGHATRRRSDLDEIEARSRTRFFRRNHPAPVRMLLRWLSGRERSADDRFESVADVHEVPEVPADVWLLSIVSQMEPAIGCLRVAKLPPAACELASRGRWYAVAARRDGRRWRLAGSWRWESHD